MAIEHASVQVARKPWGVADLRPWSSIDGSGDAGRRVVVSARRQERVRSRPCCSSYCSPASRCRSRFIRTMLSRARSACRTARPKHGTSSRQRRTRGLPLGLKRHLTPAGIARSDQDGSIAGSRSMAPGRERRHHLRPRRHDPRHRRRASCSPRFSSAATRHSVCSIMAGSANCTKTAPSPSPMRGRLKLKPVRDVSPLRERP